jgi:hypothetical protein
MRKVTTFVVGMVAVALACVGLERLTGVTADVWVVLAVLVAGPAVLFWLQRR